MVSKGDKVAYVSFETGIANVYIQDLATGDRESVLEQNTQISSPAWSPDGKYLSLHFIKMVMLKFIF